MRILYSPNAFFMQKYGGISKYFGEIVKTMHKNNFIDPIFSDFVANNVNKEEIVSFVGEKRMLTDWLNHYFKLNFFAAEPVSRRYNKYISINYLRKGNFDIFHPTYYDPYFVPYLNDKPFVLTVHDMIHEKMPNFYPGENKIVKIKRSLIENAERVIAISENTKRDIIDILNIDPDKIDVIYHGFHSMTNDSPTLKVFPSNYILYVGERKGYKNFTKFVHGYSKVREIIPDIKLVCTGHPFTVKELNLFKRLRLESSILHFFASNSREISQLYKNAQLFVFPSLYEGFGIPILEAFSNNCPIAISNTSCFPEIATDAAAYFNPDSEDSIFRSILNVLQNDDYKKDLIEKGESRLKDFSWDKAAFQTFEVYKKVLDT